MSKKHVFHVGDLVRFQMVGKQVTGIVKEDFGAIGIDGRQLLRIQYLLEEPYVMEFELPADQLELVKKNSKNLN